MCESSKSERPELESEHPKRKMGAARRLAVAVFWEVWHAAAVAYSTVGPYGEAHNMWFALYNSLDELCHYDSSHWLLAWVENRHAECERRWHGEEGSA